MSDFKAKMHLAGAPPETPLWEPTTLSKTP